MKAENFTYSTTGSLEKTAVFFEGGSAKTEKPPFFCINYFPYGKILRKFTGGSGVERYLTTGHERDEETISENTDGTGLDYRLARMSDSDIPKFNSIDPKASSFPSISPYSYVGGNPILYIDPDGQCYTKAEDGSYTPCPDQEPGMTRKGAFGNNWAFHVKDGWQILGMPTRKTPEYTKIDADGSANYYERRYQAHIEAYNTRPPDYLLEYGYNNRAIHFEGIRGGLSSLGKTWFDQTAVGLQKMIENALKDNPGLALDNEAFNDYAFDSHVGVYLEGGIMHQLPINDLINVGLAPPAKDLFHPDGMRQVMQIMPDLLPSVLFRPGLY